MRELPFVHTSVFVDDRHPFAGNQLATLWDPESNAELSVEEMQGIAREMNYSETTIVLETKRDDCYWRVRIFTPSEEIPYAGHPTLGTAFVLRHTRLLDPQQNQTALELGIGRTETEFIDRDTVSMTQNPPEFLGQLSDRRRVLKAIGLGENAASKRLPLEFVSTGFPFLIVPLRSLDHVRKATLHPYVLEQALGDQISQAVVVFTTETVHRDSDIHARMFAPGSGVPEDPATGSAAGPLGGYVEKHNVLGEQGRGSVIAIEQGHEMNRPSLLLVRMAQEERDGNALVSGKVRLMAEGTYYLESTSRP